MMTHCVPTINAKPQDEILSLILLLSSYARAWHLVGAHIMLIGGRRGEEELQSVAP